MKKWSVKAEYNQSSTVVPIEARCLLTAIAKAGQLIETRWVSDMRFGYGEVSVINPEGVTCYVIPEKKINKKAYFTPAAELETETEQPKE